MGTDATFIIQLLDPGPPYIDPLPWAKIDLRRDYTLFDLLAGARSENPTEAVIPIRTVEHPTLGEAHTATISELKQVEQAYLDMTGIQHNELRAIIAALEAFSENDKNKARVIFYFD